MKHFPLHLMFGDRLTPSERRTITIAAIVSVTALLFAYGVVPFARQWQMREEQIAVQTKRYARLRGLISHEDRLRAAVQARNGAALQQSQRLLAGRTPALAASNLQALLQELADQSQVTVSQLDVAGAPDSAATTLPSIPVTLSAIGDVYGLAELLSRIQTGPVLLEIRELNIRPNTALKGELLQITLSLRALYMAAS